MPGAPHVVDPDGPAMLPPDGQISDFDKGGSHKMAEAAIIACIALAALSVLFRVWSRLSMKPRLFGIEEGLLLCALVSKDLTFLQTIKFLDNMLTSHPSGHFFRLRLHRL